MNNKVLFLIAVLALGAVGFAVWKDGHDGKNPVAEEGQRILPGLESRLDDVAEFQIAEAGTDPLVTLQKTDGDWVVAEKSGYPAEVSHIRSALRALAGAEVLERMTDNPDYFERLGVRSIDNKDSVAFALRMNDAAGESLGQLLLGNTAERAGQTVSYVRRPDANQTWLVSGSIKLRRKPVEWLQKDVIAVPREEVQRVRIEHADGEVVVAERAKPDATELTVQNVPEGRSLTYASIGNSLAQPLVNLQLVDVKPYSEADFADKDVTRTLFTQKDGTVIAVKSYEEGSKRWAHLTAEFYLSAVPDASTLDAEGAAEDAAKVQSTGNAMQAAKELNQRLSPWVYEIQAFHYQTLNKRMDDLLQAVPETADEAADADGEPATE